MKFTSLAFLVVTPVLASCSAQLPLSFDDFSTGEHYQFQYPIRRVAIIGAGVGGLIAYREIRDAGFDVHIYERDGVPGGNWHYSDEVPVNNSIPSDRNVAVGDYTPSLPPKGVSFPYVEEYNNVEENDVLRRAHRAPKPIWKSLTSNAPAPIQQIRETPWPAGTPWTLPNQKLQRYLRAFASWHGVNVNDNSPNISYNTRVELVEKSFSPKGEEIGWVLTIKELVPTKHDTLRATWRKEYFDAIIVATGRYNAPNVPNIVGIKEWADRFPGRIIHAREYRRPEVFAKETILIVGAATSGGEIARDIIQHAKKIYQSVRPDKSPIPQWPQDYFLRRLPQNVTVIPEINRFLPAGSSFAKGQIELVNGTIISGVDRIIFATGYRYTYPFLPQYHNASLGLNDTTPAEGIQPIVTDGTHLRSLYLDAFYIPDPTLTFINANFGMQSFTHAEFVSLAIAKVWSRTADFPPIHELWRRYAEVYKARKGYGRHFQFLGIEGTRNGLRFFQGWLNDAAVKYGGRQIDGLSTELPQISEIWTQARLSSTGSSFINAVDPFSLSALGIDDQNPVLNVTITGAEPWAQDLAFNDYW